MDSARLGGSNSSTGGSPRNASADGGGAGVAGALAGSTSTDSLSGTSLAHSDSLGSTAPLHSAYPSSVHLNVVMSGTETFPEGTFPTSSHNNGGSSSVHDAWSSSIIVPPAALTALDAEFLAGELEGDFDDYEDSTDPHFYDGDGDGRATAGLAAQLAPSSAGNNSNKGGAGSHVDDSHVIRGAPAPPPPSHHHHHHHHGHGGRGGGGSGNGSGILAPVATAASALLPHNNNNSSGAGGLGSNQQRLGFATPLKFHLESTGNDGFSPTVPSSSNNNNNNNGNGSGSGSGFVVGSLRSGSPNLITNPNGTVSSGSGAGTPPGTSGTSGKHVLIASPRLASTASGNNNSNNNSASSISTAASTALHSQLSPIIATGSLAASNNTGDDSHYQESESTLMHPITRKAAMSMSRSSRARGPSHSIGGAADGPAQVSARSDMNASLLGNTDNTGHTGKASAGAAGADSAAAAAAADVGKPRATLGPIRSAAARVTRSLQPYRALLRRGHKLGEARATAICGNDATGSLFYMVGQTSQEAGVFAPLSVFFVTMVLYLFRGVYGEAVTSLPLNGGAYNVLLNTTKKSTAAIAAVLTLLSYTATAVVCAAEAMHYLQRACGFDQDWILYGTLGLLLLFAVLNFVGIGESASVALGIFCTHIATMTFLVVMCVVFYVRVAAGGGPAAADTGEGFPLFWLAKNFEYTKLMQPKLGLAIFYGFSAAMLGVTGFESSANYVEEQKPGVFVKTLRNMWVLCTIFNILLSLAAVTFLDLSAVIAGGHVTTIVGLLASTVIEGTWLDTVVCVDAFLVLAGGVLTAYVGVTGLVRRLAMDRCLPQFFLAQNSLRHTNHWIIFSFCALCCSMYLILDQNVTSLAQTYSLAFLFVMGLFALGVMLIKVKRATLVAEVTTSWSAALVAFFATCAGIVGAVLRDPDIVFVFSLYFTIAWSLILVMFFRLQVLRLLAFVASGLPCRICSGRRSSSSSSSRPRKSHAHGHGHGHCPTAAPGAAVSGAGADAEANATSTVLALGSVAGSVAGSGVGVGVGGGVGVGAVSACGSLNGSDYGALDAVATVGPDAPLIPHSSAGARSAASGTGNSSTAARSCSGHAASGAGAGTGAGAGAVAVAGRIACGLSDCDGDSGCESESDDDGSDCEFATAYSGGDESEMTLRRNAAAGAAPGAGGNASSNSNSNGAELCNSSSGGGVAAMGGRRSRRLGGSGGGGGCCSGRKWNVAQWLRDAQVSIRDAPMGFFTKNGDLSVLNKAVLYIRDNEDCSWLRIIHVFDHESNIPPFLAHNVQMLNEQYLKLRIDLVLVKGRFTPAMVAYISVKLGIGRNHLFITSPQPGFTLKLEDLGGVRLITH